MPHVGRGAYAPRLTREVAGSSPSSGRMSFFAQNNDPHLGSTHKENNILANNSLSASIIRSYIDASIAAMHTLLLFCVYSGLFSNTLFVSTSRCKTHSCTALFGHSPYHVNHFINVSWILQVLVALAAVSSNDCGRCYLSGAYLANSWRWVGSRMQRFCAQNHTATRHQWTMCAWLYWVLVSVSFIHSLYDLYSTCTYHTEIGKVYIEFQLVRWPPTCTRITKPCSNQPKDMSHVI